MDPDLEMSTNEAGGGDEAGSGEVDHMPSCWM
jgi:hypothetical protein